MHSLFTQASPGHVIGDPQLPVMSHVLIWVSLVHIIVPGVHTPVQLPLTQAMPVQFMALPHSPVDPHCKTLLPEQVVAPGVQTPPQLVPTHTYWHAIGFPYAPLESQSR